MHILLKYSPVMHEHRLAQINLVSLLTNTTHTSLEVLLSFSH